MLISVIILLIDQPDLGQSILLIGSWAATVLSGITLILYFKFFYSYNFYNKYFIFFTGKSLVI